MVEIAASPEQCVAVRRLVLALFALLGIGPLVWGLVHALAYSLELTGVLAHGLTTTHWRRALTTVWADVAYTAGITTMVVSIAIVAALALALTFAHALDRGIGALAARLPLAFPAAVSALVVFSALPAIVGSASAIVIAELFFAVPFLTLAFRASYVTADVAALETTARALGASRTQQLLRVSVPVLLHANAGTIGLLFVGVFGAYEVPQLLGRRSPRMLSVRVMDLFARFDITEKPEAMAIAVLYALAVALIVMLALRRRA